MSSVTILPWYDSKMCAQVSGPLTQSIVQDMDNSDVSTIIMRSDSYDDLFSLQQLDGTLRELLLYGVVDNVDWQSLYGLANLQKLGIGDLYDEDHEFSEFRNLEYLNLTFGKSVSELKISGTKIRALRINKCPLDSLSFIEKAPRLEYLSLLYSPRLTSLTGVEKLKNISFLELESIVNLENLHIITKLPKLKQLILKKCKRVSDIEVLSTLHKLEELLISIDVKNLDFLRTMSGLKRLRFNAKIADGDLSVLFDMPSLEEVVFNNKSNYSHKLKEVHEIFEKNGYPQAGTLQSMVRYPG